MVDKFLILLVSVFASVLMPKLLAAQENSLKVLLRSKIKFDYSFVRFDNDNLQFNLKIGNRTDKIDLREIRTIFFDTSLSDTTPLRDDVDFLTLKNGEVFRGIFRNMDFGKATFLVFNPGATEKDFPVSSITRIDFNLSVLDVNRRFFGKGFNLYGKSAEIQIANEFASVLEREVELFDDTLLDGYINRLGLEVARFCKRTDLNYQFKVTNEDRVNALTFGGGKIYVTKGLLEKVEDESELAGVLAHEIGHNVGKHIPRKMSKDLLYDGIVSAGGGLIGSKSEKWGKFFKRIGGVLSYLKLLAFSRDEEREADYLAVYNLYEMGYDPKGLASVFEKFYEMQKREPTAFEQFFETHPQPLERMQNTYAEINKLKMGRFRNVDSAFFVMKDLIRSGKARVASNRQSSSKPKIVADKEVLTSEFFSVDAGQIEYKSVRIEFDWQFPVLIDGGFFEKFGNKLTFVVLDSANFASWRNNEGYAPIIQKKNASKFTFTFVPDRQGTYYFVFDNTKASSSDVLVKLAVIQRKKQP